MFLLGRRKVAVALQRRNRGPVIEIAPATLLVLVVGPESFLAVAARIDAGRKELALRVTEKLTEQVGARRGSCEDRGRRLSICLARRRRAWGARCRAGSHAEN